MTSSSERAFYENPDLWHEGRFDDIERERAELIIGSVPPGVTSVLDIGCGNGVLTNALERPGLVVGADRSLVALGHVNRNPCQAEIGWLPFGNDSFDLVLSTEVLEHLPLPVYERALSEMVRVSRRLILVTVPYQERREYSSTVCPSCSCRFHPNYHLRSFHLRTLERLFDDWPETTVASIDGIFPRSGLVLSRELNAVVRGQRERAFPWYAVCPQCGFRRDGVKHSRFSKENDKSNWVKRILRKWWPKRRSYKWWMALYEKK